MAASGRSFAIARVSDGFYLDTQFSTNWPAMKQAGLVRGVYQFFRPNDDAVAQANLLLQHAVGLGAGDLPPVLDVEVTDGASPARISAGIQAWVNRIQQVSGKKPIIYTGSYFWNDNVKSAAFSSFPLWLASYGPVCPILPTPWSHWVMHQYSSSGSIPGISGRVDVNIFDGTHANLLALAGAAPPACTPRCDGSVIVSADCGRGDCAPYGARCVDDKLGVRCVFSLCPAVGQAEICLDGRTAAHCSNGALASRSDCGASAGFCSTAGATATTARCVSSSCVQSPSEVPVAHDTCTSGGRILHCDENGAATPEDCAEGQGCTVIGGVQCQLQVCPPAGKADVCVDDTTIGFCSAGSVLGAADCASEDSYCSTAGTSAPRCVNTACVGSPADVPLAHDLCLPDGTLGHCDSGGVLRSEACDASSACVDQLNGVAGCVNPDGADAGVSDPDAGPPPDENDAGAADAGVPAPDAGAPGLDGGSAPDAGSIEPQPTDGGAPVQALDPATAGCASGGAPGAPALAVLLALALARRRGRSGQSRTA